MNYGKKPRVEEYNGTKIINAYERYVLEVPEQTKERSDLNV